MSDKPITEDDLHAYIDDLLDETRRREVSAYLESHTAIADRVAIYCDQRTMMRSELGAVAEEPIPTRLNLVNIIAGRQVKKPRYWLSGVAAVFLVCVGGVGGWALHGFNQISDQSMISLASEAADNFTIFTTDTLRPVELRSDKSNELITWATQRLGKKPFLPDLTKLGFRMMGGRVVSTTNGAGLMLMYDNDRGNRLVVLSQPMNISQTQTMTHYARKGVDGWSWAAKGMGYSIVGGLSKDELHPIADDIRAQILEQA